jgi:RNA polymerase sigma factor for flagellar operon FliA
MFAFETLSSAPAFNAAVLAVPASQADLDRERTIMEHLSSVRFIARKIHRTLPRHVELDDLISAGMVGLVEAFNRFDATRHVQFKSYAQFRVRGAILDWLRTLDWGSRDLRRKARAIAETTRMLTQQFGRVPTEPEIADEMALELGELQQLIGELKGLELGSLNADHSRDDDDEELQYVPAPEEEDPFFLCLQSESKQHIIDAIEELPEKERLVLTLYYYEELTMREIGMTLGVVESRVSQIHSGAIRRLRSTLSAKNTGRGGPSRPARSEGRRQPPARSAAA